MTNDIPADQPPPRGYYPCAWHIWDVTGLDGDTPGEHGHCLTAAYQCKSCQAECQPAPAAGGWRSLLVIHEPCCPWLCDERREMALVNAECASGLPLAELERRWETRARQRKARKASGDDD